MFIALELTDTRSIRLNGEQLQKSSVGVYQANKELFVNMGEQHYSHGFHVNLNIRILSVQVVFLSRKILP